EMVVSGRVLPEHQISPDRKKWVDAARINELFPDLSADSRQSPPPLPPSELNDSKKANEPESVSVEPTPAADKPLSVKNIPEPSYPPGLTEPPVEEHEQIEVVKDVTPPPAPAAADTLERPRPISIIWNPDLASTDWNKRSEKEKSAFVGIGGVLLVGSWLLFAIAAALSQIGSGGAFSYCVKGAVLGLLPPMAFLNVSILASKIFSKRRQWFVKENALLAGAVCLPASLAVSATAGVHCIGLLSQTQDIVLLVGLSIYVASYAVVLLFNVFSRVMEIRGAGQVFIVGTILLSTATATGFVFKLLSLV
ncbi:MAG: hypothetical protein KAG97_06785, partial [Victivallales bacterium]|nr:hypothetical protein [Victivallales bacterium]